MESLHAERGTINMKHIKCDLRSKACFTPLVDLGGGVKKVKNQLFLNTVTLHIKLQGITNAATW